VSRPALPASERKLGVSAVKRSGAMGSAMICWAIIPKGFSLEGSFYQPC
jgi:hypothetical protein